MNAGEIPTMVRSFTPKHVAQRDTVNVFGREPGNDCEGISINAMARAALVAVAFAGVSAMLLTPTPLDAQDTVRVRIGAQSRAIAPVTLTPVFSIGQLDGPDEVAFGSVAGLVVDARGRFYVYDQQDSQIRLYDQYGKFLRNIGRKGGGPGEYQWVIGMSIDNDTVLAIHDLSAARITYFFPDGKVRGSFTEPRASTGGDNSFLVDRRGTVMLRVPMIAARGERLGEIEAGRRSRFLQLNATGTIVDSVLTPLALSSPRGFYLMTADGGNSNFMAESYSVALRSGGVVFGNGHENRFVIRTSVREVRTVEWPATPVPVGREERANWEEWADHFSKLESGRFTYAIPTSKPVYRGIQSDHDSRIWVSLYAPAQKITLPPRAPTVTGPRLYWQQPATYDVFSNAGNYLGRVVLPMRSRVLAAQGNRIWVRAKGADDEDIIRVYTMSGGALGAR